MCKMTLYNFTHCDDLFEVVRLILLLCCRCFFMCKMTLYNFTHCDDLFEVVCLILLLCCCLYVQDDAV